MANIFKQVIISTEHVFIGKNKEIPIPDSRGSDCECKATIEKIAQEQAVLAEQRSTLTCLLDSIPQTIRDQRMQLSSEIADIVFLMISKLFIHQQQNKAAIIQQVTQIIDQLNDKQHLNVALHPQDLAFLQAQNISISLQDNQQLAFTADDNVRLGGCIVTCEHGVFDASIERQIDNLKDVLLQMKLNHV